MVSKKLLTCLTILCNINTILTWCCRYADFLSRLNDDRNIRALFERALSSLPPEDSVEVLYSLCPIFIISRFLKRSFITSYIFLYSFNMIFENCMYKNSDYFYCCKNLECLFVKYIICQPIKWHDLQKERLKLARGSYTVNIG